MNQFNQFDISDVFNEIRDPLFILESKEILFFNKFFIENFIPISDYWREVFDDEELVKSLDLFFETGIVPNNTELNLVLPKVFDNQQYEWSFTNLPSTYSERFLIVMAHDMKFLSERYRKEQLAKEELLKSEEKYRTLVEESTEIIFSLSDTLELAYISPNVRQFVGYEADKVVGTSIIDYLNPEDLNVFLAIDGDLSDFLAEHQYLEFRVKHINGEFRIFGSV